MKHNKRVFYSIASLLILAITGCQRGTQTPNLSPDQARTESENRLKQLALAMKRYGVRKHPTMALFPDMSSPEAMQKDLKGFLNEDSVGGEEIFFHPVTQEPFQPNPSLSKKDENTMNEDQRAWTVMVYEKTPDANLTRACAFVDGHVKRIDENEWPKLKTSSGIQ